ncbi:hypothetical protein ACIBAH_35535 [Streptomyces sp. NPDC051445]|uniref:hypothetical protein n=1 Tax=Streptomyces sp. NPDC051445 TaxID=3365653 RepID=UPI00379EB31D
MARLLVVQTGTLPPEELRAESASFANALEHWLALAAPADQAILADFLRALSWMAANFGEPEGSALGIALDRAIAAARDSGEQLVELQLAKATYISARAAEAHEREQALLDAIAAAEAGSHAWAQATLALSRYYVDASRYRAAAASLAAFRAALPDTHLPQYYMCGALVAEGVALVTSFRAPDRAESCLRQACAFKNVEVAEVTQWVATAYHYRGRLAELRNDHAEALRLYSYGRSLPGRVPESIASDAFIDLRMVEPLVASGLYRAAHEHIVEAQRMFRLASNSSSGLQQCSIALASLASHQGRTAEAEQILQETLQDAREVGFWRGELLCLGYLMVLAVRLRRPAQACKHFWQIVRSIRAGELERNNPVLLAARIPSMAGYVKRRLMPSRHRSRQASTADACRCWLHSS